MTEQPLPGVPAATKTQPADAVGDVNSTAKGSGARFNAGKPPLDLIPIRLLYEHLVELKVEDRGGALSAIGYLGVWQEYGDKDWDVDYLREVLTILKVDGWRDCAYVFGYGKQKYAAWNWAKGMAWSIPLACAMRHLLAMLGGEDLDPESGLPHRGHVFCNVVMLLTYSDTFREGDDRPTMLSRAA